MGMDDDILPKTEAVQHTADAGEAAVSRVESLLERVSETMGHVAENTKRMAEHLASLQLQKAVEDVPATAREGVNDTIDTAGEAGGVVTKAVDVPLAATEDVIHDSAEIAKSANEDVKKARKIFKRRR